jgi:hypothetical protein
MTEEEQTEENEEGKTSRLTISLLLVAAVVFSMVFLVVLVTVLFPQIFLAFVIMFEGSSESDEFVCTPVGDRPGYEGYEKYMKTRWLTSDNITSYKDIPESERRTLSEDAKEFLKGHPSQRRDFTPIDYQELSSREKEIFKRAIEGPMKGDHTELSEYLDITRSDGEYNHILYRNTLYVCDINQAYRGA